jgi:hypothetical protein
MKVFRLSKMARDSGGEHVLGLRDTGTHACYMICGHMKPGEEDRLINPGSGHEEILMITLGELKLSGPGLAPVRELTLPEGSALHLSGDMECFLRNDTDAPASYICAGGHTPGGASGHAESHH